MNDTFKGNLNAILFSFECAMDFHLLRV